MQLFGGRGCHEEPAGAKALVEDLLELAGGNMWRPVWLSGSKQGGKAGTQGACRWPDPAVLLASMV